MAEFSSRISFVRLHYLIMIDVYLINLTRRSDRLKVALSELHKVNSNVLRIDAIDAQTYLGEEPVFISNAALACSLSHEKALREFLFSGEPYGVIAEDDLKVVSSKNFNKSKNLAIEHEIDLLQIGFWVHGLSDLIDLLIVNFTNIILKIVNLFTRYLGFGVVSKLRFKRNLGMPLNLVPDNFRAGAHCYLISRNLASELIEIIEVSNNTYDGLLMSISLHRKFKVARFLMSAVSQHKTESDIKTRG